MPRLEITFSTFSKATQPSLKVKNEKKRKGNHTIKGDKSKIENRKINFQFPKIRR